MGCVNKASVFDDLNENAPAGLELKRAVISNKVSNALLLTGEKSSAGYVHARRIAKAVNCRKPDFEKPFSRMACNGCSSCKKIAQKTHPDIVEITPENKTIKISAVRNLFPEIISKPHEAKTKVVLIKDAQMLNQQAQNALLKLLEEPPEDTFFILTADNTNSLLPTVISRCRHIRFNPPPGKKLQEVLVEKHGISPEMARTAVHTADNDPEKACQLLNIGKKQEEMDWIEARGFLLKVVSSLFGKKKNRVENLKALLLAEKMTEDSSVLEEAISIIRTFLRDIAVFRLNPEKVINNDFSDTLRTISHKVAVSDILDCIKDLYEIEMGMNMNISARLAMENFFLKLISVSKA